MTDEEFEEERERRAALPSFTDEEFEKERDRREEEAYEAEEARAIVVAREVEEAARQQEYQAHLDAPGHQVALCDYCTNHHPPSDDYYLDKKLPADWAKDTRDEKISRVMQVWTGRCQSAIRGDRPEIKIGDAATDIRYANVRFIDAISDVLDALEAQEMRWRENPMVESFDDYLERLDAGNKTTLEHLSSKDTPEARRALGFDGGVTAPESSYVAVRGTNLDFGGEHYTARIRRERMSNERDHEAKRLRRTVEIYTEKARSDERLGISSVSSLITVTQSLHDLLNVAMARIDTLEGRRG